MAVRVNFKKLCKNVGAYEKAKCARLIKKNHSIPVGFRTAKEVYPKFSQDKIRNLWGSVKRVAEDNYNKPNVRVKYDFLIRSQILNDLADKKPDLHSVLETDYLETLLCLTSELVNMGKVSKDTIKEILL